MRLIFYFGSNEYWDLLKFTNLIRKCNSICRACDCSNKIKGSHFKKSEPSFIFCKKLEQKYPRLLFSFCQSYPMCLVIGSTEFTVCHIILILFDRKEHDLQYLYNAISRVRVLCRVHVIVNNRNHRRRFKKKLNFLLRFFRDARIEDENENVAELSNLMCRTRYEEPFYCDCLSSYPSSSSASSSSAIRFETMLQAGKDLGISRGGENFVHFFLGRPN